LQDEAGSGKNDNNKLAEVNGEIANAKKEVEEE